MTKANSKNNGKNYLLEEKEKQAANSNNDEKNWYIDEKDSWTAKMIRRAIEMSTKKRQERLEQQPKER